MPKQKPESENNEIAPPAGESKDIRIPQNESAEEIAKDIGTQNELAEERAKAEKYLANWQRAQADYINLKRRSELEKDEIRQFANATLMLELLPLLDDLDIAFASIPAETPDQGWAGGIKLAYRKLQNTLEKQGLSPIKALGEPFDPRFHEAVSQGKGKDGIVVTEVQKGYSFRDKVIRPSKVIVGNGEE